MFVCTGFKSIFKTSIASRGFGPMVSAAIGSLGLTLPTTSEELPFEV